MTSKQFIEKMVDDILRAELGTQDYREAMINRKLSYRLKGLVGNISALASKATKDGKISASEINRLGIKWKALQLVTDYMIDLKGDFIDDVKASMVDNYRDAYNRYSWFFDTYTPNVVDINYAMPSEEVINQMVGTEWQGGMFSQRIGQITDEMSQDIQNAVLVGMSEGDSVQDVAKDIQDIVGIPEDQRLVTRPRASASFYRALTIARTEMIRASDLARQKVFSDNRDLVDDEEWSSKYGAPVGDGKGMVCDECWANNGVLISNVGYRPPAHPNCRCSTIPHLKDIKDVLTDLFKSRGYNGEEVKDAMSATDAKANYEEIEDYDTWAEMNLSPYERGRMGAA